MQVILMVVFFQSTHTEAEDYSFASYFIPISEI